MSIKTICLILYIIVALIIILRLRAIQRHIGDKNSYINDYIKHTIAINICIVILLIM